MSLRDRGAASGQSAVRSVPSDGVVPDAGNVLPVFACGMATLPGELGDLGRRLASATDAADWATAARVLRQFLDKYLRDFAAALDAPAAAEAEQLRDLLRQAVGVALASLLRPLPALADESTALAGDLKRWSPGADLSPLATRVRELCHQVGVHAGEAAEQQRLLLELFDLLLENLFELLDDGSWLRGQVAAVRRLLGQDPDLQTLEATRQGLRELAYQQGLLRQGIEQSKDAMRVMMVSFVESLDGMAARAGEYQDRLQAHLAAIREARTIADLGHRLEDVLDDTRRLQEQALRSHEQLQAARADVEAAEARVRELEAQLRDIGELASRDPLTGALNRRGLEEQYPQLLARAEREGWPLAVAVLDLDEFRRLNGSFGHAGGDAALRHVVQVLGEGLRKDDLLARYGGEEFVVVLPRTTLEEAAALLQRLQRTLAARPLLHEGRRIEVRFSAGVAVRQLGEDREHLLNRADRAMYRAKQDGRNRVVAVH
ncbi:GGDEF domain-containing protein [Pseudoxanthomonas sp. SGNA-20]|uniref:GGDEF domain-containing protein n=1 Tax=Pseudoxanthomonas sp. SGNA-20 TaxID=2493088 RepID=UPI000F63D51B|nr:GGDEF domain-containing protein [Pseudoxanthomonas sp. SGNA-20]RRN53918.1 GGDEF domain-containing protein [Pseudoxanthomonas sp. SGNA-20]